MKLGNVRRRRGPALAPSIFNATVLYGPFGGTARGDNARARGNDAWAPFELKLESHCVIADTRDGSLAKEFFGPITFEQGEEVLQQAGDCVRLKMRDGHLEAIPGRAESDAAMDCGCVHDRPRLDNITFRADEKRDWPLRLVPPLDEEG